jgi:hypothetical protein
MPVPFHGGCLCKAIRYEVAAEPLAVMNCHCRDCQYASGGGFTTAVVVPRAAFRLLKGTPKTFATVGENGKTVIRHFCGDCGTPLFGQPPNEAIWVVKAATMDDPSGLTMSGALFVKSAQPWAHIDPALPAFEAMPPVRG